MEVGVERAVRLTRIYWFVFLFTVLASTGSGICRAQTEAAPASDVSNEIQELRKEIQDLRSELAQLKSNTGSSTPDAAASAAQLSAAGSALVASTPIASSASSASAKPDPLAGLAGVLGGATFTGIVDGYYSKNFNHPSGGTTVLSSAAGDYSSLRLFDPRNDQFALSLIELGLVKNPAPDNRLGYKVIFGFGDTMQQVNVMSGGDPGFLQYLKEGYASVLVPAGKGLQIDLGKFVTPNGAEVIESNSNWNYSRSLLFNYAIPFYHYGMRAQYTFNPALSLTGYVVNGWNDVIHDSSTGYNNSGKTGGLTLAWAATRKLTVTENWMGGPGATQADGNHWRNLFDTILTYNPTSKLSLIVNGDYGRVEATAANPLKSVDWWGIAGYIKYQLNPLYALATRYEYYSDPNGYTTGIANANGFGPHINEVTSTFERRIATHLISRLEYRHDQADQAFFPKGKAGNSLVNSQDTIAAAMVFVFEPGETK